MSTQAHNNVLIRAFNNATQLRTAGRLDKFAVLLSGVCLFHCLLAPVGLTLLPILPIHLLVEDVLFHQFMLWLVLPTSIVALFIGCRKHRDWLILSTGFVGITALAVAASVGHDVLTPTQERLTSSVAAIILAVSHYLNFRACQQITCGDRGCKTKHHH